MTVALVVYQEALPSVPAVMAAEVVGCSGGHTGGAVSTGSDGNSYGRIRFVTVGVGSRTASWSSLVDLNGETLGGLGVTDVVGGVVADIVSVFVGDCESTAVGGGW